jgi:hypothetical protein
MAKGLSRDSLGAVPSSVSTDPALARAKGIVAIPAHGKVDADLFAHRTRVCLHERIGFCFLKRPIEWR